jgi:hypothetical protein
MDVKLSEFSDHVQYIPLETSEGSIIGGNKRIDVTDNYIIVRDGDNCFLFDKQNGSYIRKIGSKGRGPNEYVRLGFVNPIKERIYFHHESTDLLEFDVEGQFIRSIKTPTDDSLDWSPYDYTFFNDSFIGSFQNVFGTLKNWMILFNSESTIHIFPNRNIHPHTDPRHLYLPQTHFYHYNDNIFFRDDFNDTVYLVTENAISPYLVFNAGKNSLPYEAKWWPLEKLRNTLLLFTLGFMESESYVFFFIFGRPENQVLIGVYNKKNRELKIADAKSGIENDIDHFISFRFHQLYNKELIGWIDAWKLEQWFKDNPDKAAQLPPHIKNWKI